MNKLIIAITFMVSQFAIAQKVDWVEIKKAQKLAQKQNKIIMIDVYTTWCGPCEILDKKTLEDPKVSKYLNTNFIPVKFDAETKEIVEYNNREYEFLESKRSRTGGINLLTIKLLGTDISYPSIVFISPDGAILETLKGYRPPQHFLKELKKLKN